MGLVSTKTEEYEQAENYFTESLVIKRDLGDQRGLVSVLINFAEMHLVQQHWEDMFRLCSEAIEVIGNQPFHEPLAIASFLMGIWHFKSGDIEAAARQFAQAIAIAWNFNSVLGQRINRSIARHIKTMSQIGKNNNTLELAEAITERAQRLIEDQHSPAIDNLKSLLMDEQS